MKKAILYKFYPSNIDPDTVEITALQGRYDWRQLAKWYEFRLDIWSLGLNSSNIDEAKNGLEFGATDQKAVATITRAFLAQGVPADAFEVQIAAPFIAD